MGLRVLSVAQLWNGSGPLCGRCIQSTGDDAANRVSGGHRENKRLIPLPGL